MESLFQPMLPQLHSFLPPQRAIWALGLLVALGLILLQPPGAQAKDASKGPQVCALRWGMNHDLGYCGRVLRNDGELRHVKLESVRRSYVGFGWSNACSGWQHLGSLKVGQTLIVHRDCLDRKPGLLRNWRDTTVLIQSVAGVALLLLG
jgi:hypothetical protein